MYVHKETVQQPLTLAQPLRISCILFYDKSGWLTPLPALSLNKNEYKQTTDFIPAKQVSRSPV